MIDYKFVTMPSVLPDEVTAAETTTLTAPRQSSQLLQVLRLVLQGSVRELRRYLARGGDPNAKVYQDPRCNFHVSSADYTGPDAVLEVSLVASCCSRNWTQQIGLLIDAGADPDIDVGTNVSPMYTAACVGNIAIIALLLSKGASVNCDGYSPLMVASWYGKLQAVKWLIDHGADVTAASLVPSLEGRLSATSATILAAASGHMDIVRFLHTKGAPFIAEAGGQINAALHEAASKGHTECVRFILSCGFAVDARTSNGLTALHYAAQSGQQTVIKQLLNVGADIHAEDAQDFTPLMYAARFDRAEAVTLLIARGAILQDGRAANKAALTGSTTALKTLMTSAQWLAMSRTERLQAEYKLLHSVEDNATLDALRGLVSDMSTLVQSKSPGGDNALHFAARHGKAVPLICALIKEGVDPTATNLFDQTPTDVAREAGHTLQATLLDRAAEGKRRRELQQQTTTG